MRDIITRSDKAALCTIKQVMSGQSPVFEVTSGTSGKVYTVVVNSSGLITCNCPCGINHQNESSPCSHVDKVKAEMVPA